MLVEGVHRIAVLRANRLGDFLIAVPALEALRAAYPAAEIVLLARQWHADLLSGRPGPVDRVVPVPPTRGVVETGPEDPAAVEAFVASMRTKRFDLAVQMHGGGRWSNPLTARLGARCTVGLRAPDAPALDRTLAYSWYQPEVLRYLELVGLVGAEPVTLHPGLSLMDSDRAEVDALDLPAGPLVALHPGAEDPRRCWPVESFAAVGDGLAAAGATVLVTGSGAERAVVAEVVGAMTAPALSLVDSLSIGGLAAVYDRCAVVVANDTGPRHLAEAVDTPTVAIIWCGNLVNFGPLGRRRHRAHVSWVTACPVCAAALPEPELPARHHGRCPHEVSWMTPVDPTAVLGSATELLRDSLSGKGLRPAAGVAADAGRPST